MIENAKSQLAKLMATENINVEQRKVKTAYFDLKNRTMVVPIFKEEISNDLLDLFMSHEVSHGLHTPPEGWHDSIKNLGVKKSILNVCEDARIEKKIKRKFPGLRVAYTKGYREIIDMDFFALKGQSPDALNLIDRINLETKCGIYFNIYFDAAEKSLLEEVQAAETFEETVAIAQKIQQWMIDHPGGDDDLEYGDEFGDDWEDGGGDYDDEELEMTQEEWDALEESDEEGGRPRRVKITNPKEKKDSKDGKINQGGTFNDADIESHTDKAFREREKDLYGTTEYEYVNVPDVILDNIVVPYKVILRRAGEYDFMFSPELFDDYNSFRKSSGKSVAYLVKEFELRKNAAQMAKAKTAKTGDLDTNKLYQYKFAEDIFKRLTVVPNGKSHGLVMLIDWSGSMSSSIHETIKQCLVLAYFCKKVNIPFDVYGFTSCYNGENSPEQKPLANYKEGDLVLHHLRLMNLLSSNMTASEFRDASLLLFGYHKVGYQHNGHPHWMSLGGTPLNESVLTCMKLIPKFRADNKLDIVNLVILSDGEGSPLTGAVTGAASIKDSDYYPAKRTTWNVRNVRHEKVKWVVRDPASKQQVIFKWYKNTDQTVELIKLMKMIVNCNVVGFYIMRRSAFREVYQDYKGATEKDLLDKFGREFSKSGCFAIDNVGYDDYYFIYSSKLDILDEDFGEIETKGTTAKALAREFTVYSKGKHNNKLILNRFITRIV